MQPTTSSLLPLYLKIEEDFAKHLEPVENSRIIFSGIYGAGKTTFLEHFFKLAEPVNRDKERNSDYEVIRLFPIHYSIASNDDILQYIKYDILIELIRKGIVFEKLDLGTSHKLYLFAKDNWLRIGARVARAAVSVGKSLIPDTDYIEPIFEFFKEEFKSFKDYSGNEIDKKFDEDKITEEFLKEIENKPGSLFEDNIIVKIIEKKIQQLKDSGKKVVLIIDDLDRMDPEHIFRILNIFAAHFDITHNNTQNKFGFDKVILVCDIDTIRGIFYHKYGKDANFDGYIDKFYSEEVFTFDIVNEVCNKLLEITKGYPINNIPDEAKRRLHIGNTFFTVLINCFVRQGSLNLRALTKYIDRKTSIDLRESVKIMDITASPFDFPTLGHLMLLCKLFGDRKSFINATEKIEPYYLISQETNFDTLLKQFLYLATSETHRFTKRVTSESFTIEKTKGIIIYSTENRPGQLGIEKYEFALETRETDANLFDHAIAIIPQTIRKLYQLNILG